MDSQKKQPKGQEQAGKAKGNIDLLIRMAHDELYQIKMKTEILQKQSRQDEENRRQQRQEEIKNDSNNANRDNAALEMKWEVLREVDECEELFKSIQEQKEVFNRIIYGKDSIIKQFQDELNYKDDEFGKTIKEQAIDIQTLVKTMRVQFAYLREKIENELDGIETEFIEERTLILQQQQAEIKALFDKHTDMEKNFVLQREEREELFTKKIEQLRIEGVKSFADMKIQMELEIQNLEKCFEDMKALYQLNTEKLDYNLKVLKEKEIENTHLHDELKRKDQNHNNRLRNLIKEYNDSDAKAKQKNKELSQQYKRITRQFKELQRKFKHFDKADQKAYNDIQSMNELEVRKLKDAILKCDQTIHIQQLGVEWQEPVDQKEVKEKSQVLDEEEVQFIVGDDKLEEIVDLLSEEVDFLIDDKLRETLQSAQDKEQIGIRLGVIKKCLNIDSIEEMNMFIEQLIKECRIKQIDDVHMHATESQQQDSSKIQQSVQQQKQVQIETPVLEEPPIDFENFTLNQNLIIDFLIRWMKNQEQRKQYLEKMSSRRAAKQETERQKKERIAKEGKKYWEKLTQVLPERTFNVWRILDKQLTKYYELLLQRQKLIDETGQIHNHNEDLKNIMNQYLQINHELIIPPTRFLKVQQENFKQ
ncbi:hypothetical protein pb186bvf_001684 [Paramecium bursaria]